MRFIDGQDCGPPRRFGDAHIYYLLMKLDKDKPISRLKLSETTGIGEGSIRKIISILKEWKAISINQTGMTISQEGLDLLQSIPVKLIDVKRSEYVVGAHQRGTLVRGVAEKITNGIYQRDKGIIAGASGASVFVIREGILIMPLSWNMDTKDPDFAKELRSKGMEDGDVMVICGASDPDIAAVSAISIALDLL